MTAGKARLRQPLAPGVAMLAAAVVAVVGSSCTEINAAADHVASLEFSRLPYPSIVAGDSLRDSLGVAAPLHALAFNNAGAEVVGAQIQYIALDTGLTISGDGYVVAQRRSGFVQILASAAAIQTKPVPLIIARRPDSVAFSGPSRDTIDYVVPDVPSTNVSAALGVKVMTSDTAGGITTTEGWLVSYETSFHGAVVTPGDTSGVFLIDDGVRRSTIDTTAASGVASRRLRVNLFGITPGDSATVTATVRYKGADVRGSPLQFVILLRPKP